MTFFCTLRHEIMTGVMILLQALHDGGYEFAPSGMIFGHAVTSLNKQKGGSACKKARCSIVVSLVFTPNTLQLPHSCGASDYNYHTHVVLQARMPVCTVLEACTPIVSERPVDSLAAPQATANSSVARMLHATPVQRGHVKGGYGHRASHLEGTMCTDRLVRYYLFSLGV